MSPDVTFMQIPGYPDYVAGSDGEVYSLKYGRRRRLLGWLNSHGYRVVAVRGGERRRLLVHKAVALAFHGQPTGDLVIRHIDGNHLNNVPGNLAWGTRSENAQDAIKHGTHVALQPWKMARGERHGSRTKPERVPRGERSGSAKITNTHVVAIRAMVDLGFTISHISRSLAVPRGAVKCVVQGKTWRHLQEAS
jgi:hypothetical protein